MKANQSNQIFGTDNLNSLDQSWMDGIEDTIQTADVLYQKLGTEWYAFSVVEGEVYSARVSEQMVEQARELPQVNRYGKTVGQA